MVLSYCCSTTAARVLYTPVLHLQTLTRELIKNLDSCLWADVFKWAAFYEHRLHLGSKEILHLEAFVAKFMSIYKAYIIAE